MIDFREIASLVYNNTPELAKDVKKIREDLGEFLLGIIDLGKTFEFEDRSYCAKMKVVDDRLALWVKFKKTDRDLFLNIDLIKDKESKKNSHINFRLSHNIQDKETIRDFTLYKNGDKIKLDSFKKVQSLGL